MAGKSVRSALKANLGGENVVMNGLLNEIFNRKDNTQLEPDNPERTLEIRLNQSTNYLTDAHTLFGY